MSHCALSPCRFCTSVLSAESPVPQILVNQSFPITQDATGKRVLLCVLTHLHHPHWRRSPGRGSGRIEGMDLYLTGLAPKLSIPGPCLAGEKCGGFCFFLLTTRCRGGGSHLSDVLILSSGEQKLLPPVISHSGGAEPNTAVSSRTLPLTGELAAKTQPWSAFISATELNKC